jgi:hypothetical protein
MSWEDTFRSWASPPSQTEQDKCDNAERAITKAVGASKTLQARDAGIFVQGSYRNRTNVRLESDVDIGALCDHTFLYDLPPGTATTDIGISPATYHFPQYKNDVEIALRNYFGANAVTRGDKAFDVHENSYRVDADVVPCFPYRLYNADCSYREGRAFFTDAGKRIVNWPEQNYKNGVDKNDRTNRGFKAAVRILKRLRNQMADDNIQSAKPIASYLIECLTWNAPDEAFTNSTHTADVRYVLAHLYNNMITVEKCQEWTEINDIKYLFHSTQPWTREQGHRFISDAWDYLSFE